MRKSNYFKVSNADLPLGSNWSDRFLVACKDHVAWFLACHSYMNSNCSTLSMERSPVPYTGRLHLSQGPWKIEENVRKCGRSWRMTLT